MTRRLLTRCGTMLLLFGCRNEQTEPRSTSPPSVNTVTVVAGSFLLTNGSGYLSAVLRDSAGFVLVGRPVTWMSSDTTIAAVSSDGYFTALRGGQVVITATSQGIAGSLPFVIPGPAPIATITVIPDSVAVELGQSWQLNMRALDSAGRFSSGASPTTWASSDTTRVRVSANGVVSAIGVGTAIVSASSGGKSGQTTVRVFPVLPVGSLILSPDTATVLANSFTLFTIVVKDTAGNRVFTRPVSWSTVGQAVVNSQSRYEAAIGALAPGAATVIASSGTAQGSATLRIVAPPAVAQLSISPTTANLVVGRSLLLATTALDAAGNRIFPPIVLTSSDSSKALISFGSVTAIATGTVTITATAGGRSAQAAITVSAPVPLPLTSVSAGRNFGCGSNDAGAAYCWGLDYYGVRGDGAIVDTVAHPVPGRVGGGHAFTSIVTGETHACAISGSTPYCWGANVREQLGTGALRPTCVRYGSSLACSAVPVLVAGGLTVRQLSAGGSTTCAVTTSDAAWCWGDGGAGQLGAGITSASASPVAVSGNRAFSTIAVGSAHACALTNDGRAYCWGSNSQGQLGAPTRDTCTNSLMQLIGCSATPLAVSGGLTFASIYAGGNHSCALTIAGAAYCWGANASGELGNATEQLADAPTPASTLRFSALALGESHTCGITSGGTYCWGLHASGQLGTDLKLLRSTSPLLVAGGFAFERITAGAEQSCGVANRVAYCWGNNSLGALGTGDTQSHSTPTIAVTTP